MTGAASDEVLYRVEESGVAWLTLNRPEAGNSLTREQRSHILAHLEDAGADLGVRAIVLTASGDRHFCTGGDLRPRRRRSNARIRARPTARSAR